MSQATLPVEITFRTGETTRLYFVAETAENDFNPSNNVMELTFVAPEGKSPLMGVDYPDLSSVPVLNSMVELPALPEVETFTSLDLERFINQLPYLEELRKLESAGRDLLNRLLRP